MKTSFKDKIFIYIIGIWIRFERAGKNLRRKDLDFKTKLKRIWWGY